MSSKKTSITAYIIATSLAKFSTIPRWSAYISPEAALLSTAFMHHACDTLVKRLIRALPPVLFIWVMDTLYVPGMAHHYLFRKLLIENAVAKAIEEGARQIIILGGGFDTLTLRVAKQFPNVQFFEIDLPATQQTKLRILHHIGYAVPTNCIFIAADLAHEPLDTILRNQEGFSSAANTLIILEGVLMYLSETEVQKLFITLRNLFSEALTIIFGAMAAPDEGGGWGVRLINRMLRSNQEGTYWYCPSAQLPFFMETMGYRVKTWESYKGIQSRYRNQLELNNIPDEDENYYTVAKMT